MGYTNKSFLPCDNSTDAIFRTWGSAISAQILAMGWAKTTDTGQVNWTTVTHPGTGALGGYEIWKPTDALQTGASQFFVRVEYRGASTNGGPSLNISIGTGTNGSGTLTGPTIAINTCTNTTQKGTSLTFESYFSGDVDRLGMMLWRNASDGYSMVTIERTKNVDGTNNSDGVTLFVNSSASTSTTSQQTLTLGGNGAANAVSGYGVAVFLGNNGNGSDAFANNIPISPVFPDYGFYGNPMTVLGAVHTQDVSEACFFTTTLYGATRTYLATARPGLSGLGGAIYKACMRYD